MPQIRYLAAHMEQLASLAYQESYDNAGLIVDDCGRCQTEITGVLVTFDATEAVIDEAIATGRNVVVAHHPVVFKESKRLNGDPNDTTSVGTYDHRYAARQLPELSRIEQKNIRVTTLP